MSIPQEYLCEKRVVKLYLNLKQSEVLAVQGLVDEATKDGLQVHMHKVLQTMATSFGQHKPAEKFGKELFTAVCREIVVQSAYRSFEQDQQRSTNRCAASPLLRRLTLFKFILDKKTRERVFAPAFEDLTHQYLLSRRFRSKAAKRWLKFAFGFRAVLLIADSFRVMVAERIIAPFAKLIPNELKRWWLS